MIEPTGNSIPIPTPTTEVGLVTSRGFPSDAITLPGLFKYRNETIDFQKDALSGPGAFQPTTSLTYQMVMRGGGCKLDFGWYNATVPPTMPAANDLHVLISKTKYQDPVTAVPPGMACVDPDFCPLATHTTVQTGLHEWADQVYSSSAILADPSYKGGLIGFAIFGYVSDGSSAMCNENHYSQRELNTQSEVGGQPWITALMWRSTATPGAYYIGFEDWPMSALNWTSGANDGDFNDFVFFVSFSGAGPQCP